MSLKIDALTSTPDVRMMPMCQQRIVSALRLAVIGRRTQHDVADRLEQRLGCAEAVEALGTLIEEVGDVWPEQFAIFPPCQTRLSYDEMLFVDITTAAAKRDWEGLNAMVGDMLSKSEQANLMNTAYDFMRALFNQV